MKAGPVKHRRWWAHSCRMAWGKHCGSTTCWGNLPSDQVGCCVFLSWEPGARVPQSRPLSCPHAHGPGPMASCATGLPGSEPVCEEEMKTESGCRLQKLERSGWTSLDLSLICQCLSTKPQAFIHRMFSFIFTDTFMLWLFQVFLFPSPGEQRARHRQDIFCQQLRAALCHHAPTLYHEGTARLSLAVLFSSAVDFFPWQKELEPSCVEFWSLQQSL